MAYTRYSIYAVARKNNVGDRRPVLGQLCLSPVGPIEVAFVGSHMASAEHVPITVVQGRDSGHGVKVAFSSEAEGILSFRNAN